MLHHDLNPRETTLPQLVAWLSVHEEYVPDEDEPADSHGGV